MWGIKTYGDIQTYRGAYECIGAYRNPLNLIKHAFFVLCMYMVHLNMWGIQTYGGVKTYGDIQIYRGCTNVWGHMDTP